MESVRVEKTYDLIQTMGLGRLSQRLPFSEIKQHLNSLCQQANGERRNSIEALSLIAQLPRKDRESYYSLIDADPRSGIDSILNAYLRSLKKIVNPESRNLKLIYGCSGADCTSPLLATDASELIFVDTTSFSLPQLQKFLKALGNSQLSGILNAKLEQSDYYLEFRKRHGGAMSGATQEGDCFMTDFELKFLFDLQQAGVDLNQVTLQSISEREARIEFDWQYHGAPSSRKRSVTLVTADLTKPDSYPPTLKGEIEKGFDLFFMKGAFFVPRYYPANTIDYIRKVLWHIENGVAYSEFGWPL